MLPRIASLILAVVVVVPVAQGAEAGPAAAATPADAPAAAPQGPTPFTPGMDDLMTLLVAPRHTKLYYAGARRNWELAAFQLKELRASFRRITANIPYYLDRNIEETITALMEAKLKATEEAIGAADSVRFTRAYGELTSACNACHTYLEHPFLVVKVPDASAANAYPGQEFKPAP